MNKTEYLTALKVNLKGLPSGDIEDALEDINEYFEMGLRESRTEEEIARGLTSPRAMARAIKADYSIKDLEREFSIKKILVMVTTLMGLGFINMVFLPLIASYVVLVLSFYLVVGSFYLTGGLLLLSPVLYMINPAWVTIPSTTWLYMMPLLGLMILPVSRKGHKGLNRLSSLSAKHILRYFKVNRQIVSQ